MLLALVYGPSALCLARLDAFFDHYLARIVLEEIVSIEARKKNNKTLRI